MQNELFYTFILAVISMMFGYGLHISNRTLKLEKKNGREQHQIDQLKQKIEELESILITYQKENELLKKEVWILKEQLAKYQKKYQPIEY